MSLHAAKILPSGALEHDRGYAIFDGQGELVNGKRTAQVHRLRSSFDLSAGTVSLRSQGKSGQTTFHINDDRQGLEFWLGEYFGFPVELKQIPSGLPDHGATPGPTVISTASLEKVSEWFHQIDVDDGRNRFRINLEIEGVPAFWEDRLIGKPGTVVEFQVGEVLMQGVSPCERCVVPSRDPLTGKRLPEFQRILATKRKANMPRWAELSSFPHFYHFCVLTRIPKTEAGKVLRVGDEVKVREVVRR